MLDEFARCYRRKTGSPFDTNKRHIRWVFCSYRRCLVFSKTFKLSCLAHIINLATPALISTRSKAKYYEPNKPDDDQLPEATGGDDRGEVGLIRAICVKVC
jgi:hypothetical protein